MINIKHLLVTVTRDCNLNCKHCLCGEPLNEQLNLESKNLINLLKQIDKIKILTITGGEPFLHQEGIIKIIKDINKFSNKVEQINIITNGLINLNDNFILNLLKNVKIPIYIIVSNDNYHPGVINKNFINTILFLQKHNNLINFKIRDFEKFTSDFLIESSRTIKNNINADIKFKEINKNILYENNYIIKPRITLTIKGNIILSDILSWEQEDDIKNIFCNVKDFKEKFMELINANCKSVK